MENVKESYKGESDRELLEQALAKLSQIETKISLLKWDIDALKVSSRTNPPDNKSSGGIGSQSGFNSTQSGY